LLDGLVLALLAVALGRNRFDQKMAGALGYDGAGAVVAAIATLIGIECPCDTLAL